MNNVKQAWLIINGQRINAIYDAETDTWSAEGNAPAESSWGQADHVYKLELHAEDEAGNEVTMDSTDATYGEQLKLRVLEKTKPVATITSPTQNSVLGSSTQNIVMELEDFGGSGLNMSSVVFKLNNTTISSGLIWTDSGNKKVCTYIAENLSDGANTIELSVTDNDGNKSTVANVSFIISTVAPGLEIQTPVDNIITKDNAVTVSGIATPGSAAVTIVKVTINGVPVQVGDNGEFSYEITGMDDGTNTIEIIAEDSIGKTTKVVRTVTVDTQAPVISDVVAEALVVDASGKFKITFKVTDN